MFHAALRSQLRKAPPQPGALLAIAYEGPRESGSGQSYQSWRVVTERSATPLDCSSSTARSTSTARPFTVVVNENLDVPRELCDGSLRVRVDFEETPGVVHVSVFTTKTGEPIGKNVTIRVPR